MAQLAWIWQQFTNLDGTALSGGSVDVVFAGTAIKATTYQDPALTIEHTNPIILGSDGFPPASAVYIASTAPLDFIVKDDGGAVVKTLTDIEALAQGPIGPVGPAGPVGPIGPVGPTGEGVPIGGAVGEVLAKKTIADYDTEWISLYGYALNCDVQTVITDYVFDGTERRDAGWAVNATLANRTVQISPDLFATGWEAVICKWDSSANTVTLDALAGNVIDGAQTFVLTKQFQTVTLVRDGANTWKIKSAYFPTSLTDATYLRLDCSNSPISGPLAITNIANAVSGGSFVRAGATGNLTAFDLFGTANSWTATQSITGASGNALTITSVGESASAIIHYFSGGTVGAYTPSPAGKAITLSDGYFQYATASTPSWRYGGGVYLVTTENQSATAKGVKNVFYSTNNGNNTWGVSAEFQPNLWTIPAANITWSGNPTHSGTHTFSGTITAGGGLIVGDSLSDTFNAFTPLTIQLDGAPAFTSGLILKGSAGVQLNVGEYLVSDGYFSVYRAAGAPMGLVNNSNSLQEVVQAQNINNGASAGNRFISYLKWGSDLRFAGGMDITKSGTVGQLTLWTGQSSSSSANACATFVGTTDLTLPQTSLVLTNIPSDTMDTTKLVMLGAGNVLKYASLAGTLALYLPLTGGTITGNLTIGDAATDTLTVNATPTFATNIATSGASNIGATASPFGRAYLSSLAFSNTRPSADNTITASMSFVRLGGTTTTYNTTLPLANAIGTSSNQMLEIVNETAVSQNIIRQGTNTIIVDGIAAQTSFVLQPWESCFLYSNTASVWVALRKNTIGASSDNTVAHNAKLTTNRNAVTTSAVNYQILVTDNYIRLTYTGKVATLTAATGTGQTYTVANRGTGNNNLTCAGTDLFDDGLATMVLPVGSSVTVIDAASGIWEVRH